MLKGGDGQVAFNTKFADGLCHIVHIAVVRPGKGLACLGKIRRFGITTNKGDFVTVHFQFHWSAGIKNIFPTAVNRPAFFSIEIKRVKHTLFTVILEVVACQFHDIRAYKTQ